MPPRVDKFSLVDRFFADAPAIFEPGRRGHVGRMLDGIKRDLEDLLNARLAGEAYEKYVVGASSSAAAELRVSPLAYGVLDLSDAPADDRAGERVRLSIEAAIKSFEPRLHGVAVVREEVKSDRDGGRKPRVLHLVFRVNARTVLGGDTVRVTIKAETDDAGRARSVSLESL